jgi:hypothetical protein
MFTWLATLFKAIPSLEALIAKFEAWLVARRKAKAQKEYYDKIIEIEKRFGSRRSDDNRPPSGGVR